MLNLLQPVVSGLLLEIDPAVVTRFLRLESRKLRGAPKAMTARTFNNKRYFGMVIADKALKPGKSLEECKHVQAMHQHFEEGRDWSQTEYLKLYEKKYKKMERHGGESGDFKIFARKKLKKYDSIYRDIERNGYKQSASIEENIEVALDANGEFFLIDGRHRLVLAQLIGLKKIPVVVNLIAESMAQIFVDNAENLRNQLQSPTVDQRVNALITVPGGRNDKGVLVNAFQRTHFPG